MHALKTSGIVLKRSNLGEADKILTIFTERFGKIKAIAKGVRKIKSKMAGSLEPFMLVNLQLYEGKTFYTVTGTEIVQEFSNIQSDLAKLSRCFFLGELIDKFFEEHQRSSATFQLFTQAIETVANEENEIFFWYFCFQIIEQAGFRPSLHECVHCHKKILPEQNYWDNVEGGVICSLCQSKFSHGQIISNDTIKILRLMNDEKFSLINKVNFDPEVLAELKIILDGYISSKLEREPKSRRFLQENS